MVVDDNPANVDALLDQLLSAGFEVAVAQDGEDALEQIEYKRPDLILLDVVLPGIDGFETCRRLKADNRMSAIPVIFLTSLADLADKLRGFAAGGVDYLTKPFQQAEVLARVRTHLAVRDMTRQLQEAKKNLEQRVAERTAELAQANQELQLEIAQRKQVEADIQRRNRELALLNRVIAASVSQTQPEAILQIACCELAQIFEIPQAHATLLNEQRTEATIVAEYLAPRCVPMLGHSFLVAGNPALEYLINQQAPLVVDDARRDLAMEAVQDLIDQRGSISLLALPLLIDGAMVWRADPECD